jgi:hypothetical protein
MGDYWMVRTPDEIDVRVAHFAARIKADGTFPVAWRAEPYRSPRSIDQNALLHVWSRDFARHVLDRAKVTSEEQEAMRITLQRHCYADTGWAWLIDHHPDLFTGETKPSRRSTTKFSKGEMFKFLSWIQARAADHGLVLESLGEYAELQESQHA